MTKPNGNNAFTLIEMMVVMAIFTIIAGAMVRILLAGGASWRVGEAQIQVVQEARKGMSGMLRELSQTRPSQITGVPADDSFYNSIAFRIPSGTTGLIVGAAQNTDGAIDAGGNVIWSAQIQYSRGGANNKQLLRTTGGISTVIANNVTSLTFRRLASTPDIVEITIGTQRTTTESRLIQYSLSNKTKLRN